MIRSGWTDEPVTNRGADLLGREGYARRVARLIAQAHSWESSTVFGLTGPWGSGKTSLINLIEQALVGPSDPDSPVDPAYAVVPFTPWATHDASGLFGEFFSALTAALPSRGKGEAARKAFGTLLRIAAPAANVIPVVGGSAVEIVNSAASALVPEKPWDVAFEDATAQIRESGKKILVVVDDVDRLQGDELLAVLKVVRLLGRFPGVQYLLAYDHDSLMYTLTSARASQNPAAARRYIEKMIQYPIAVPALIGAQINALVNQQLEISLKHYRPENSVPLSRFRELAPTVRATLGTPRAIGRYIAQLNHELGIHIDGETDLEDVIILTLLRTSIPELYNRLPRYQHELVTGNVDKQSRGSSSDAERFDVTDLLSGIEGVDKINALAMLVSLFPKLGTKHAIGRRKGVSQASYFGRYFTMSILDAYDIPDSRVNFAIREACNGRGANLVALLCSEDLTLASLAFDKSRSAFSEILHEETSHVLKDELCVELMKTVIPAIGKLGVADQFMLAVHAVATNWVGAEILPSISDGADSAPIIQALNLATDTPTVVSILLAADNTFTRRTEIWWKPVLAAALPLVQECFLAHLRKQDLAKDEPADAIKFFTASSSAGVDLAPLREGIAAAISVDDFRIDDLAARFVFPQGSSGIGWDQVSFDIVAPAVSYDWYDQTVADIPDDVYSWVGRRALAVGHVKQPPQAGTFSP